MNDKGGRPQCLPVHLLNCSTALARRARCARRKQTRPHDPEDAGHLQKLRPVARGCMKKASRAGHRPASTPRPSQCRRTSQHEIDCSSRRPESPSRAEGPLGRSGADCARRNQTRPRDPKNAGRQQKLRPVAPKKTAARAAPKGRTDHERQDAPAGARFLSGSVAMPTESRSRNLPCPDFTSGSRPRVGVP